VSLDGTSRSPESTPLASTLFFPLSGDPVGFNHFAAAEAVLRAEPSLERVTFILSNGIHPDPKKPDAEAAAAIRHEILAAAVRSISDPGRSTLARQAELAREQMRIDTSRIQVSTREFSSDRAVRAAETAVALRGEATDASGPIHWYAGSDLLGRMTDFAIFDDDDLQRLARECAFHVVERQGDSTESAVGEVERLRGVRLSVQALSRAALPPWLAFFLRLSSTDIRRAAEAGDPLTGMLPQEAAGVIRAHSLYRPGRAAARLIDLAGDEIEPRSALALDLAKLERDLGTHAVRLADHLDSLRLAGRPHTLALLETSAGGLLTSALARRSGASRYFKQSRFAYDETAKANLVGDRVDRHSAVSKEMVVELARALRREAGTDFAVAESGMAGPPDGRHKSLRNGECWIACATPSGTHSERIDLHPFATRREHQLRFALHAITQLEKHLA
jgi:PncC family amidohydrolase